MTFEEFTKQLELTEIAIQSKQMEIALKLMPLALSPKHTDKKEAVTASISSAALMREMADEWNKFADLIDEFFGGAE